MTFVFSNSASGLVIASEGADEAAAAAALRQHDPDLRLVPQNSDVYGRRVYKVYRYVGSEREAEFVCGWWDELGNPYPLSVTGLLDMVQRLDKNSRGTVQDADIHNAELRARRKKDADADFAEIAREYGPRLEGKVAQPQPRSRNLYLARNRVRARTKTQKLKP